ncbi:MAG: VWA domain-containing protein, partial [Phycisphaerales bacterium]|nr:VWA domain-containing protein [Phycisphaerales bacterium]
AAAIVIGAGSSVAYSQPIGSDQIQVLVPQRSIRVPGIAEVAAVKSVHAEVRIVGSVATTTLTMVVYNPTNRVAQARVVVPVPDGAAINTFGIDGIGDEPTAELLPRDEATRRYREIVRQMVDPGLLEFVGNAMIQSSVFPVEPGAQRTVTIAYEQVLDAHRGTVEYVLPRSAGVSDSSIGWDLEIVVESDGTELGAVFSPSHPIVSTPEGDRRMRVDVPMLDEPGAFVLYASTGDSTGEPTVLMYPTDETSGYFMFVADAPDPIDTDQSPMLREVTIVIDRSGSMGGEKIEQAKESAKQIVYGMAIGERISIVDYSSDVRSFADGSVVITKESRKEIIAYIDRIRSGGGTNLHDALVEALRQPSVDGMLPLVLFMTDGLATEGKTGEVQIRDAAIKYNTADRRVFTFGLGFDVNAPLLDAIAQETKGESTYVLPGEDVEIKVGRVFDKLNGPVMTGIEFAGGVGGFCGTGMTQETRDLIRRSKVYSVEDGGLGDLYQGSRVVVLGKYENHSGMPLWLRLSGDRDGHNATIESYVANDEASTKYSFIPRLWAQQRIDSLITQIRVSTADGSQPSSELVDEVTSLSLEHGIMTEYTAFLATEDMAYESLAEVDASGVRLMDGRAFQESEEKSKARSGRGGVSQSMNRKDQRVSSLQSEVAADAFVQSSGMIKSNQYFDADMNQITISTVQRGKGSTLYRKAGRWVDVSVSDDIKQAIDETVEFATDAYWSLVDDLASQGRQWIIANRGDVELMNHGKRILVKNPK